VGNERKKIVAVDDNVENLTALKNTLKNAYDTYPCPCAQKMFNLMEHVQPDLILLDVEMPEMNGYEAAQKLKSSDKYKTIPIIFLTSMEDEESKKKGLSLGAVDFISKPIVAPALLQRLETLFFS
jgi:putative two-component system response regulator